MKAQVGNDGIPSGWSPGAAPGHPKAGAGLGKLMMLGGLSAAAVAGLWRLLNA